MHFPFFQRTAGLALGSGEIALACIRHYPHALRIDFLEKSPLSASEDTLIETARDLVARAGCRGWHGAVALPAKEILKQEIRMAASLTEAERETELYDHLADYLPGTPSPARYCIDHVRLGTDGREDDILLVAAREETVHATVAIAEKAGLVVRIVDVDEEAAARALAHAPLASLSCSRKVERTLLAVPDTVLLVALGLGMRRAPAW